MCHMELFMTISRMVESKSYNLALTVIALHETYRNPAMDSLVRDAQLVKQECEENDLLLGPLWEIFDMKSAEELTAILIPMMNGKDR